MSFFDQDKSILGPQSRVIMAKRRYQHEVLEYNRQECLNKSEARRSMKEQVNKKYAQINHDAIESLQIAEKCRLKEKLCKQSLLKEAYDRQLRQKEEKCKRRREQQREYASLYNQYIEYDSQRRVNELISLYQQPTYVIRNRRAKTQTTPEPNPQGKLTSKLNEPNISRQSQLFPPINKSLTFQNAKRDRHFSQERQRRL